MAGTPRECCREWSRPPCMDKPHNTPISCCSKSCISVKNEKYMNTVATPTCHNEGAGRQPAHIIVSSATLTLVFVELDLASGHNTPSITLFILYHEIPEVQLTLITMYLFEQTKTAALPSGENERSYGNSIITLDMSFGFFVYDDNSKQQLTGWERRERKDPFVTGVSSTKWILRGDSFKWRFARSSFKDNSFSPFM